MPFTRPTLTTLIDRGAADIESRLAGSDARLRRALLNVLVRAHAGAVHQRHTAVGDQSFAGHASCA